MTSSLRLANGATLAPWRCDGLLTSGRPCNKLLAEVDLSRPMCVRVICGRCGHENTLLEPYLEPAALIHATMSRRGDTAPLD